jgi:hypothetical protein
MIEEADKKFGESIQPGNVFGEIKQGRRRREM